MVDCRGKERRSTPAREDGAPGSMGRPTGRTHEVPSSFPPCPGVSRRMGLTIVAPPLLIPFLIIPSGHALDGADGYEGAHARTTEWKLRAVPPSRGGPRRTEPFKARHASGLPPRAPVCAIPGPEV